MSKDSPMATTMTRGLRELLARPKIGRLGFFTAINRRLSELKRTGSIAEVAKYGVDEKSRAAC